MMLGKKRELKKVKNLHLSPNLDDYNFLRELNNQLVELERKITVDPIEKYPTIFILGLPRSGSTLLSQLIFNNLNVNCTNNLIARFWKAPLVGCYLSKIIIGQTRGESYKSTYAKTSNIFEPHEFGWFWQELFKMKDITKYDPEKNDAILNWKEIKGKLLSVNAVLDNAVVYKPMELVGFHFSRFNKMFSKAIFIYIERNKLDIAKSLYHARLDHYGDKNIWWGSYPKEYQKYLKDKRYNIQIGGQIYYLQKMYDNIILNHKDDKIIRVSYENLCENPDMLVKQIRTKIKKKYNYDMEQINVPKSFVMSSKKVSKEVKNELIKGMEFFKKDDIEFSAQMDKAFKSQTI